MTSGTTSSHPTLQPGTLTPGELDAIDRSIRGPVLFLLVSASVWLVVGSLLLTLAATKMVFPGFIDAWGMLSYGRVFPAGMNAFVYGWLSQAGIAVGIWMVARLCRGPLVHHTLLICGAILWNLAVFLGVLAILGGGGTSLDFLEFPGPIAAVLLLAYLLVAVWAITLFRSHRPGNLYVSLWYLIAAFLSFPWLYGTANALLVWAPVPGSASGPIQWWFGNGLITLWLMTFGFAILYYFIPKAAGRPIFSFGLANLGFWSFLFFASWSGMTYLVGGPIPVWLVSASVAATVLLLIPLAAVSANLRLTMGEAKLSTPEKVLPYFTAAFVSYVTFTVLSALTAFPAINGVFHFSMYTPGMIEFVLYGFVTFALFGAAYVIVPALCGTEWIFPTVKAWQFWLAVTGLGCVLLGSVIGGMTQGFALMDPQVTFVNAVQFAAPFRWLVVVGELCILAANLIFAKTLAWTLLFPAVMPRRSVVTGTDYTRSREVVSV